MTRVKTETKDSKMRIKSKRLPAYLTILLLYRSVVFFLPDTPIVPFPGYRDKNGQKNSCPDGFFGFYLPGEIRRGKKAPALKNIFPRKS